MAEQTAAGTVEGRGGTAPGPVLGTAHAPGELEHFSGRRISWIGVVIVCAGFIIGGIAMVPRPLWWLFWVGAAIVVVGGIIVTAAKTFSDDWY